MTSTSQEHGRLLGGVEAILCISGEFIVNQQASHSMLLWFLQKARAKQAHLIMQAAAEDSDEDEDSDEGNAGNVHLPSKPTV